MISLLIYAVWAYAIALAIIALGVFICGVACVLWLYAVMATATIAQFIRNCRNR